MHEYVYGITNLDVSYGVGRASEDDSVSKSLSDVSLSIRAGSRTAILGGSGSGKSTLLAVLGTLRTARSCSIAGRIAFTSSKFQSDNLVTATSTVADEYRRKSLGFVLPDSPLLPNLSCLHNLSLPLLHLGCDRSTAEGKVFEYISQLDAAENAATMEPARTVGQQVDVRADEISEFSASNDDRNGLRSHLLKYPTQLSSGQRQRFAVLRSIMHDPSVILADEPFSNLDPFNHSKMLNLLSTWQSSVKHENGRPTVVLVSHHWETALEWADEVFLLRNGVLVENRVFSARELREDMKRFTDLLIGKESHG